MKKISIIGIGKLGICLGLNLERSGYEILGVDVNQDYVNSINDKTLDSSEPMVNEMLQESKNLRATTDLKEAIEFSDTLFILVATPSLEDGKYDHSSVESVIEQFEALGKQENKKHFIIGCTVMPGYSKSIKERLNKLNYSVNYNPEFIAQGTILRDQLYPDMVLIGEEDEEAGNIIEDIYKNVCKNDPSICKMDLTSSELTKIALNCFITTKISFANMIGDIAKSSDADHEKILNAIGSDSRVGNKCLKYGYGFGGPCFPRDNRALFIHSDEMNYDAKISKVVDDANKAHLDFQIAEFIKSHPNKEEPVVIEGVAYKKGAVIIEESQKLLYAVGIANAGYNVTIIDSEFVVNLIKDKYGDLFNYGNY